MQNLSIWVKDMFIRSPEKSNTFQQDNSNRLIQVSSHHGHNMEQASQQYRIIK